MDLELSAEAAGPSWGMCCKRQRDGELGTAGEGTPAVLAPGQA